MVFLNENKIEYTLNHLDEKRTYYNFFGKHQYNPPCFTARVDDSETLALLLNETYWLPSQNEFYSISFSDNLMFELGEVYGEPKGNVFEKEKSEKWVILYQYQDRLSLSEFLTPAFLIISVVLFVIWLVVYAYQRRQLMDLRQDFGHKKIKFFVRCNIHSWSVPHPK